MWCTCVHSEDITTECIFVSPHLEFEPLGSAVTPNPTSFKNGVLGQKDHVSHWMDKIIYEAALTRSNTARKYWSPTKLFVIRKIFWMYFYRNCLQRYTKCVAFLELNSIKEKSCPVSVRFLLGIFCYFNGPFPEFARSAKSSRRP